MFNFATHPKKQLLGAILVVCSNFSWEQALDARPEEAEFYEEAPFEQTSAGDRRWVSTGALCLYILGSFYFGWKVVSHYGEPAHFGTTPGRCLPRGIPPHTEN